MDKLKEKFVELVDLHKKQQIFLRQQEDVLYQLMELIRQEFIKNDNKIKALKEILKGFDEI